MTCREEAKGLSHLAYHRALSKPVLASDADLSDQECLSQGCLAGLWPTVTAER